MKPPGFVDPPAGMGMARYTAQLVSWSPCGDHLQCARVSVPLDYDDPDGQAITLKVTKKPATGSPDQGDLFVNPGGPGEAGTALVGRFDNRGLEGYTIVGWDPRGTGESTPVQCFEGKAVDDYLAVDTSPDDAAETKQLIAANRRFGAACLAGSGALLEHISTLDTVADLDLLRQLLQDKLLTYLGYSYGTEIGARYAQSYPTKVKRMVLDSAVNINGNDSIVQAQGFDRALDDFASWCADRGCALGKDQDDVVKSVTGLWDTLDANPVKVGSRQLTQSLAVTGVAGVLYQDQRGWDFLRQAIIKARQGDGRLLLEAADDYNRRNSRGDYDQLLFSFAAIRCLDEADPGIEGAKRKAAQDEKKAPVFGKYFGPDFSCPTWPVAAIPKPERITAPGAPPIVVIGTTRDPATPYEYAVSMAKQLDSGILVTRYGEGHTAYGDNNACIDRAVVRYLADNIMPADGTRC